MGNPTGNADKKSTKTGQNYNKKEKATQEKNNNTTWGNKPESIGERRKIKEISYRLNRTFQNNVRKFYQQLGEDDMKTYQQPYAKEIEQFWTKIWQPKT